MHQRRAAFEQALRCRLQVGDLKRKPNLPADALFRF
jgi:hypothetical protein